MPNPLSFQLQQKPSQNIKQLQRLIMSRQMQQAIHFLELPIMELTPLIDLEMEQNPLLEYSKEGDNEPSVETELKQLEEDNLEELLDGEIEPEKELIFKEGDFEIMRRLDEDFQNHFSESGGTSGKRTSEQDKLQTFQENSIIAEVTLFEHLMGQVKEAFLDVKKQALAEAIIGNLDQNGFLTISFEELSILEGRSKQEIEEVLEVIQTFDPIGVGATGLKDSLLIQLKSQGKENLLAYAILSKHFDDLLHNRILSIKKGLNCKAEEIERAIDVDIAKLDLHPGMQLSHQIVSFIVPDVTLRLEESELIVAINDDSMPSLRLNSRYMRMLNDELLSQETKDFIKQKIVSAKWLLRNITQRNETLEKIAEILVKKQSEFFLNPDGKLIPMTMKFIADELNVNESTIARSVSGKYIDTPRGLLPLRSFFTNALMTHEGSEISSTTARDILQELIDAEDKQHPLSDEQISVMINERGIHCARRTVAKYRMALKIGTAQQRRKYTAD